MSCLMKQKKKATLPTPIKGMILVLAMIGIAATVREVRERGETARRAISRAGCRCKAAAQDAAAEILGTEND